jgi:signal transduction histidine kinase/CheY-like chemotaxis protein
MTDFSPSVRASLGRVARTLLPPARFSTATMERAFLDDYARTCAARRQASAALALAIWTAFIGFDLWVGGSDLTGVLLTRAAGVSVMAACLALSFHPLFLRERLAERLVLGYALGAYIPLLFLVATVDGPGDPLIDAVGLMAFFAFVSGFTFLRARAMLALGSILLPLGALALAFDIVGSRAYPRRIGPGDVGAVFGSLAEPAFVITLCFMLIAVFVSYASAAQREQLARAVFARERRLAEANAALERSRQEAETRNRALLDAKDDLQILTERNSQEKSKFLADATHDLSQPMHAVSLLIAAARHAAARADRLRAEALLDSAATAVRAARTAFGAVLDLSQLESGLARPCWALVDTNALVDEVLAPLRVLAEARGVRFRVRHSATGAPLVRTDRALLARALANIVSNAIKYADPAKGAARAVLVGVVASAGRVRIDVVDNGVGIPQDRAMAVFEPFVQLNNPERNRELGVGLGLSIVKATVALLEGHAVTLRSRQGRGTRVSLTAPRLYAPLPAPAPASPDSPGVDIGALFVWCVEDDTPGREAFGALLEALGARTQLSASLDEVERSLAQAERAPDLVISDFHLSGGRTALDVARTFDRRWAREIPLLIVTGDVSVQDGVIAPHRGRLVRKPVDPEAIIGAVARLHAASRSPAAAAG